MAKNDRTYLQGQVKYLEGKVENNNLVRTLAQAIASKDWQVLRRFDSDVPWSFDFNRQIILDTPYRDEDVRLFRKICTTNVRKGGKTTGEIIILQDARETSAAVTVLLNGITYTIPYEANDTKEQIAAKVHQKISGIDGFDSSTVNGNTISIIGTSSIYELSTNYGITGDDLLTVSTLTDSLVDGEITIISEALKTGLFEYSINGKTYQTSVEMNDTPNEIADKIVNDIKSDFIFSFASSNVVNVVGEVNVNTISSAGIITTPTLLRVGQIISKIVDIEILLDAQMAGNITLVNNGSSFNLEIVEGQSKETIATNLRDMALSKMGLLNSVVEGNRVILKGGSGISDSFYIRDCQLDEDSSEVFITRKYMEPTKRGEIYIPFVPKGSGTIGINCNGVGSSVNYFRDSTELDILRILKNKFIELGYTGSLIVEDRLKIAGSPLEGLELSTDSDSALEMNIISNMVSAETVVGELKVMEKALTGDSLNVVIDGTNYDITLADDLTPNGIAATIADTLSGTFTTIHTDNEVVIKTNDKTNIKSLDVLSVEIPKEAFTVNKNVITGIGTDNGTFIGDNVEIKVASSGQILDYTTFKEKRDNKNNVRVVGKIKSRPEGVVTLYEAKLLSLREVLVPGGDGQTYSASNQLIVDSEKVGDELIVYKDNTPLEKTDYLVDYFNGVIFLKEPIIDPDTTIEAAYKYFIHDELLAEIPKEKYQVFNDKIIDITPTKELLHSCVIVVVDYSWELQHPQRFDMISGDSPRVLLKTKVDISALRNQSYPKQYYVELRQQSDDLKNKTGLEIRFGTVLDETKSTIVEGDVGASPWCRLAFYKENSIEESQEPTGVYFDKWLPVKYFLSYTAEGFNLILQGDPSADVSPYTNFLVSHAYVGLMKQYDNAKNNNREHDFMICTGSDKDPSNSTYWGSKTGVSTEIIVEKTGGNMPYQGHYASFYTNPEFMDKKFIGPSEHTGHYHMSEVTVLHSTERERGKIPNLLIADRSAIHHLDRLISNKDEFNTYGALQDESGNFLDKTGNALVVSKQKEWKMFAINSPFWFGSNSPNGLYGVALRTI